MAVVAVLRLLRSVQPCVVQFASTCTAAAKLSERGERGVAPADGRGGTGRDRDQDRVQDRDRGWSTGSVMGSVERKQYRSLRTRYRHETECTPYAQRGTVHVLVRVELYEKPSSMTTGSFTMTHSLDDRRARGARPRVRAYRTDRPQRNAKDTIDCLPAARVHRQLKAVESNHAYTWQPT